MIITTDICIVGGGVAGLFAVLEAGASKMHCCILEAESSSNANVKEQALSDYLKLAISEFNPVFTDGFLQDVINTDQNTFLVKTSKGREIACKHVVFTECEDLTN